MSAKIARTNSSLTGQPATTRCPPTPADEGPDCKATEAFESCTSILAEGEPAANVDSLSLGNADGFPGASEGGYVYLSDLTMDVTGSVKISVH